MLVYIYIFISKTSSKRSGKHIRVRVAEITPCYNMLHPRSLTVRPTDGWKMIFFPIGIADFQRRNVKFPGSIIFWIFQVCKFVPFHQKAYQKAEILHMGVSKNRGTPKSSILIGFSIILTIHFGVPLFLDIFGNTHI